MSSRSPLRAVALLLFPLIACDRPSGPVPPADPPAAHELMLEGLVLDRWLGDRLEHRGFAERATIDRNNGTLVAQRVEIDVLDRQSGQRRAHVTAPKGTGKLEAQQFDLSGGVRVVDREGRILETESASYDAKRGVVVSKAPVSVQGGNFELRGQGALLHIETEALEVDGPIAATVSPDPKNPGGR